MRRVISIALLATVTAATAQAMHAVRGGVWGRKSIVRRNDFTYSDLSRDSITDPDNAI